MSLTLLTLIGKSAFAYSISPVNLINQDFQNQKTENVEKGKKIDASFWKNAQENNLNYYNFIEKTCYQRFWVTRCLDEFRLLMKSNAKRIKQEELSYQQVLQEHERKVRYYQTILPSINDNNSDKNNTTALDNNIKLEYQQSIIAEQEKSKLLQKQKKYTQKVIDYDKQFKVLNNPNMIQSKQKTLLKPLPVF